MPIDRSTKEPKGIAYITFASASSALSAYKSLDKKSFQGRLLHILGAVDRKDSTRVAGEEGKKKTIKGDKDAKRKAGAGKEFNWGMLYMNVSWGSFTSLIAPRATEYGLLIAAHPERRRSLVSSRSDEDIEIRHLKP